MSPPHRAVRTHVVVASILIGLTSTGCETTDAARDARSGNLQMPSSTTSATAAVPSTSPTPSPHLTDYSALLLQAGDLSDAEDTFTERSSQPTPDNVPGASKLFVNADDTRAISVTVGVFPGASAATETLHQAVATADTVVSGATAQPLAVGTDGTMLKGTAPDGSKAVTLVLFTQGRALARLQFASAPGDVATERFVTDIAKMQQIALRVGIPDGTR